MCVRKKVSLSENCDPIHPLDTTTNKNNLAVINAVNLSRLHKISNSSTGQCIQLTQSSNVLHQN